MKKVLSLLIAGIGLLAFSSASEDSAAAGQCFICRAIVVDGQILQTCPGYNGPPGGKRCIIAGEFCHTEGDCELAQVGG